MATTKVKSLHAIDVETLTIADAIEHPRWRAIAIRLVAGIIKGIEAGKCDRDCFICAKEFSMTIRPAAFTIVKGVHTPTGENGYAAVTCLECAMAGKLMDFGQVVANTIDKPGPYVVMQLG